MALLASSHWLLTTHGSQNDLVSSSLGYTCLGQGGRQVSVRQQFQQRNVTNIVGPIHQRWTAKLPVQSLCLWQAHTGQQTDV